MALHIWSFLIGFLLVKQASATCGTINSPRIINGIDALPCSNPWHVHVHYVDEAIDIGNPATTVNNMACSGVIIDKSHVLISPTCMFLFRTNTTTAMETMVLAAGDTNLDVDETTEQYRRPTEIYYHPLYTFRTQAELLDSISDSNNFFWFQDGQAVIVKVEPEFTLENCVNEICLPEPNINECAFSNCILSANGLLSRDPLLRLAKTQVSKMTTIPSKACNALTRSLEGLRIPLDGFCARAESASYPCVNDAGGPLACSVDGVHFLRGTSVADFCNSLAPPLFWDASLDANLNFMKDVIGGSLSPFLVITHA